VPHHCIVHDDGSGTDRNLGMSNHRLDPVRGVRAQVAFFGPQQAKLFGCAHTGNGTPHRGLVICPPLHAELMTNYRNEVILGDALASSGVAVQRFQYRGTGNSDGDPKDMTFDSMLEDALAAAAWLRQVSGAGEVAFLGTRFGALIAAAAARHEGAPLALWEPVTDAATYFREAFRARLVYELRRGGGGRFSRETLVEDLRRHGWIDIMGYPVGQALYEGSMHRTLGAAGDRFNRVLLIQLSSPGATLRVRYVELQRAWSERGAQVETHVVPDTPTWWFFTERWEPQESRPAVRRLVSLTTDWMVDPRGVRP
jgi:hypothetical protein